MVYHRLAAYSVFGIGAASLSADICVVERVRDDDVGVRAVLTSAPDPHLYVVDRGIAFSVAAMKGTLPKGEGDGLRACLSEEVERIQTERSQKQGPWAALVVDATGSTELATNGFVVDCDDFCAWSNPVGVDAIRAQSQAAMDAVTASLLLALGSDGWVEKLTSGLYFLDEAGKVLYPTTWTANPLRIVELGACTEEMRALAKEYADVLIGDPSLATISRLLTRSFADRPDRLRAFVSAWTALEVLITSTFKRQYKQGYLRWLKEHSPESSWDEFLASATEIMEHKYSLRDKFNIVSHFLAGPDPAQDRAGFRQAKCARDKLTHGEDVSDAQLPLEELQSLLIGYLAAHLRRQDED